MIWDCLYFLFLPFSPHQEFYMTCCTHVMWVFVGWLSPVDFAESVYATSNKHYPQISTMGPPLLLLSRPRSRNLPWFILHEWFSGFLCDKNRCRCVPVHSVWAPWHWPSFSLQISSPLLLRPGSRHHLALPPASPSERADPPPQLCHMSSCQSVSSLKRQRGGGGVKEDTTVIQSKPKATSWALVVSVEGDHCWRKWSWNPNCIISSEFVSAPFGFKPFFSNVISLPLSRSDTDLSFFSFAALLLHCFSQDKVVHSTSMMWPGRSVNIYHLWLFPLKTVGCNSYISL